MKNTSRPYHKPGVPVKLVAAALAAFSVLILTATFLVRDKLLRNADEMGTRLAQSYAAEEENRISLYEMLMNLGAIYMNESIQKGESVQEIQEGLASYSRHLGQLLRAEIIDPYAVVNGQIVAAVPWEGDRDYEYENTQWYEKALKAQGTIVFTDAYIDAITGRELVTVSKAIQGEGNVLAFDILLENFHVHKNKASMPPESSYFLYDSQGKLLYGVTDLDIKDSRTQEYAGRLLSEIREGNLDSYNASIRDLEGNKRGVYYYAMDNGWLSVITIPLNQILMDDLDGFIVVQAAVCIILFAAVVIILVRSFVADRKMKKTAETLQILGDTYYAIYRINYETETYESVKSSEDVMDQLGKEGDYSHLIQVVKSYVDQDTYKEFETSFSVENIRRLVRENIYEFGGEYQRRFGDEYKWVSIRIIFNKAMGLNQGIMCFREIDLEKRRQLQQQILLENALKSAKRTAKQKNMFFSSVSHDMRTPLNAVIGLCELARHRCHDPEAVSGYLDKIQQSGRQLLALINDILDITKLEHEGGSSLDYTPMDLKQCIEDSAAIFTSQAEKEGKTLQVLIQAEDVMVYCDPMRLNQILNNLLSNAIKYSTQGGKIDLELHQLAREKGQGKYQITVRDTGIGMSQDFLKRIFEPFARETRFAPAKITGTGLGMPIVKSLVQQMSGEITVESRLGEGSTFTVTLPLQIAGKGEVRPKTAQKQEYSLKGRRLLVAEDNEINMEIAQEFLTEMGAEVIKAWNGREAVEIFQAMEPGSIDAVLMDMQMPEMDGCQAAKAIREMNRPDSRRIPIVAVTANAFAEDIARTTQAGMNAHVSKPIDFQLLKQVLGQLWEERSRQEDPAGSHTD